MPTNVHNGRRPLIWLSTTVVSSSHSKEPWKDFGRRLRFARVLAGLRQEDVSVALGKKGNAWISSLEGRKWQMPSSLTDVVALAGVLGVAPEWLLFGRTFEQEPGTVEALGLDGRPSVEVTLRAGDQDLLALWPGQWRPEGKEPAKTALLICSSQVKAGRHIVVWREGERYAVGKAVVSDTLDRSGRVWATTLAGDNVQPVAQVIEVRDVNPRPSRVRRGT